MSQGQRSAQAQPRNGPRTRRWTALLFGLVALIAVGMPASTAEASPGVGGNPQKYLGTWNYDQPDQATMRNIAVISCPTSGGTAARPAHFPCR